MSPERTHGWRGGRTEKLSDNTLDGSSPENGEGVASVRGDDPVLTVDGRGHTNRDGLLSDGKVAESSDELGLVKHVASLLHLSHRGHLGVHVDEEVLGDLDGRGRRVASVRVEPEREGPKRASQSATGRVELSPTGAIPHESRTYD